MSAMEYLTKIPPSAYFDHSENGQLNLRLLVDSLISSGFIHCNEEVDDVERVFCVLKTAADHGMIKLILDYLHYDPFRVKDWLILTISSLKHTFYQCLQQNSPDQYDEVLSHLNVGTLTSYLHIATCLAAIPPSTLATSTSKHIQHFQSLYGLPKPSSTTSNEDLLRDCHILIEVATVLGWMLSHGINVPTNTSTYANNTLDHNSLNEGMDDEKKVENRFNSRSKWVNLVASRRTQSSSCTLFIDDMLKKLSNHSDNRSSSSSIHSPDGADASFLYPPLSLGSLLSIIFFSPPATTFNHLPPPPLSALSSLSPQYIPLKTKLAIICYTLLDACLVDEIVLAPSVESTFGISPSESRGWSLLLYIDKTRKAPAVDDQGARAILSKESGDCFVNMAVEMLPCVNGSVLPIKAVEEVLEKGRPDIALCLLRQRSVTGTNDVEEACTALRVRLGNGLLVEAFIEMKRHLRSMTEVQRARHAQRLLEELLRWGANMRCLQSIIRLPLTLGEEESCMVNWFEQSMHAVPQAGLLLTLYFLMRGRFPEACHAYSIFTAASQASSTLQSLQEEERKNLHEMQVKVEIMLSSAVTMMPDSQRALRVGSALESAFVSTSSSSVSSEERENILNTTAPLVVPPLVLRMTGDADDHGAAEPSSMGVSMAPELSGAPLVGSVPLMAIASTCTARAVKVRGGASERSVSAAKQQHGVIISDSKGVQGMEVEASKGFDTGGLLFGIRAEGGAGTRRSFLAPDADSRFIVSGKHAFDRLLVRK